jgi:hypothetical protein
MAVEAQLGVIGEVGAKLEKERPEIIVDGINVVVVDHRRRLDDPRIRPAAVRAVPLLGAEDRSLLLRLADKNDPFFEREVAQALHHHIVFALAFAKQHDGKAMPRDKAVELHHKPPAHRAHQGRGGQRLPAMVAEKAHRPIRALQPWHVDVEVHAVDPLDRQPDMIGEKLGHPLCYHHHGSGRTVLPYQRASGPLIGPLETGVLPELVMNRRSEPPQHAWWV